MVTSPACLLQPVPFVLKLQIVLCIQVSDICVRYLNPKGCCHCWHSDFLRTLICLQDCSAAGKAGRMERRWDAILGPGTWPEVLRRYALTRAGALALPDTP